MILNYDADLTEIFNPNTPRHTHFYGLEIEMENQGVQDGSFFTSKKEELDRLADLITYKCPFDAVAKWDGSLDYGFELVTAPYVLSRYIGRMDNLIDFCTDLGFSSWGGERCGLHIHVNKNSLSQFQIAKIISFIYNPANFQFVASMAQRHSERYADFSSSEYRQAKRVKESSRGNYARYTAVNLENKNTLEFRLFRGSLNAKTIYKNLEFVDALIHFTKGCNFSYGECSKWLSFYEFVRFHFKQYPNLYSYIINRMARIVTRAKTRNNDVPTWVQPFVAAYPDFLVDKAIKPDNIITKESKDETTTT